MALEQLLHSARRLILGAALGLAVYGCGGDEQGDRDSDGNIQAGGECNLNNDCKGERNCLQGKCEYICEDLAHIYAYGNCSPSSEDIEYVLTNTDAPLDSSDPADACILSCRQDNPTETCVRQCAYQSVLDYCIIDSDDGEWSSEVIENIGKCCYEDCLR